MHAQPHTAGDLVARGITYSCCICAHMQQLHSKGDREPRHLQLRTTCVYTPMTGLSVALGVQLLHACMRTCTIIALDRRRSGPSYVHRDVCSKTAPNGTPRETKSLVVCRCCTCTRAIRTLQHAGRALSRPRTCTRVCCRAMTSLPAAAASDVIVLTPSTLTGLSVAHGTYNL